MILLDWEDVTGVDITLDGATYTLDKEVQEETDEDGSTTETYVYQLEGETVEITDALDALADLEVSGSDAGAPRARRRSPFTFHQDKEAFPTVTPAPSPSMTAAAAWSPSTGRARLLVSRDGLLDLIDTFRTLLQGE